jgi:hypothetical protein
MSSVLRSRLPGQGSGPWRIRITPRSTSIRVLLSRPASAVQVARRRPRRDEGEQEKAIGTSFWAPAPAYQKTRIESQKPQKTSRNTLASVNHFHSMARTPPCSCTVKRSGMGTAGRRGGLCTGWPGTIATSRRDRSITALQ